MAEHTTTQSPCPTVKRKIGKMTYIVKVHFNNNATETMADKIKRMLRNDLKNG